MRTRSSTMPFLLFSSPPFSFILLSSLFFYSPLLPPLPHPTTLQLPSSLLGHLASYSFFVGGVIWHSSKQKEATASPLLYIGWVLTLMYRLPQVCICVECKTSNEAGGGGPHFNPLIMLLVTQTLRNPEPPWRHPFLVLTACSSNIE